MNVEKSDCRFLNGYKPCAHHKRSGEVCAQCSAYEPVSSRILIIKVGAAGEVVRTTPLITRLKSLFPKTELTWITDYPELIPSPPVDRIKRFDWRNCLALSREHFDLLLNLDKENACCALAEQIPAAVKKGFGYSNLGKILPWDQDALRKWRTGIDDGLMLKNTKHYLQEVFEICGFEWRGEPYVIPDFARKKLFSSDKYVVGLNIGAGPVWATRIPAEEKLVEIIVGLRQAEFEIVLLGGPDEHERNTRLSRKFDLRYFGVKPRLEFLNVVDQCQAVITPVTFTLHVAIGLEKIVVLLNNVFNRAEFHLFGRGLVVEPELPCLACYKTVFDRGCAVEDCTRLYDVSKILAYLEAVRRDTPT